MICIVDDNRDVRSSLENFLRAAGVDARAFASAEQFLGAQAVAPDCLITDVQMPGMDGLQLQAELNRRGRSYPVVVVTAYPAREVEAECRRLGTAAFFSKPVDPERLLQCVQSLCREGER